MALEKPREPIAAGELWQLVLVVRNDGEVASRPLTLIDVLLPPWHISRVHATKGLVSSTVGQVQVAMGRIQAGEQVIITADVQVPYSAPPSPLEHCVSLFDGEIRLEQMCAPLPAVVVPPGRLSGVTQAAGQTSTPSSPMLTMTLLQNVIGQQQLGQLGSTLIVRNEGNTAASQTYLHIQLGNTWRLSDLTTTMGLVSIVGQSVRIHMGQLDAKALVVVTVRGWPMSNDEATFCATLSADGQAQRRWCGNLSATEG